MKVDIKMYDDQDPNIVVVDNDDLANLDHTFSRIIHPALINLKEAKQGAPYVDNEDVPSDLHRPADANLYMKDSQWFDRWNYVIDEMIYAFGQISEGNGDPSIYRNDRVDNGIRLFAKYYSSLWG